MCQSLNMENHGFSSTAGEDVFSSRKWLWARRSPSLPNCLLLSDPGRCLEIRDRPCSQILGFCDRLLSQPKNSIRTPESCGKAIASPFKKSDRPPYLSCKIQNDRLSIPEKRSPSNIHFTKSEHLSCKKSDRPPMFIS